ncbi:uncharacterized protein B0H18DRAFT_955099 [Fomitopsis serialis]|uniref:uncharacterized protein n=1 Tax=Fomitopsis serialis TaxID=139415 RepID=UPI0020073216|nr:uncharacterized protein B0H18DRAFT_955099 [Neoantrodia serialis]KAH9925225.1 hypothetical protein B0H18DRAFT_955099 [Neoantrodia serialis]
MGAEKTGKSTFINMASGSRLGVGTSLQPEAATVQPTEPFKVGSQRVVLVNTPGFNETSKSDREILSMIAEYLADLHRKGMEIKGVIFLHRVTDNRMDDTALRNMRMFEALCGKDAMRNAVIVLNMWDQVGNEIREAREKELRESDIFFKHAVDAGAYVVAHDGQQSSADGILAYLLKQKSVSLQIQRETTNEDKKIPQTAAGIILLRELATREGTKIEELQRLCRELEEVQRLRRELEDWKDEKERKESEVQMDLDRPREELEKERLQGAGVPVRRYTDDAWPLEQMREDQVVQVPHMRDEERSREDLGSEASQAIASTNGKRRPPLPDEELRQILRFRGPERSHSEVTKPKLIVKREDNSKTSYVSSLSIFINCVAGSDMKVGLGLESCTTEIQCISTQFGGEPIMFADTPGFDDTQRPQREIVELIERFLQNP